MARRHKRDIAHELTLWICMALVVVGVVTSTTAYTANRILRQRHLQQQTELAVTRLAQSLALHVWNLDERAIQAYFDAYPPSVSLAAVRVETQFGDPLFVRRFLDEKDVVTASAPVRWRDEEVGAVEASFSLRRLQISTGDLARIVILGTLLGICATVLPISYLLSIRLGGALRDVVHQLRTIAAGSFQGHLPEHRYEEIDLINREVNLMVDQIAVRTRRLHDEIDERRLAQEELQRISDHLEALVAERTSALQETSEKLRQEGALRRRVQAEMLDAVAREQQRIGQDLHDTLCQQLAGIAFMCSSVAKALQASDAHQATRIAQIGDLVRDAVGETRRVAKGLNPVDISEDGLAHALDELAQDTARVYRVVCRFSSGGESHVHRNFVALHLYHIAREAIYNAIRHGRASEITVRLTVGDAHGALVVVDNGTGFDPAVVSGHGMGLHSMRYRAEDIGGAFDIVSQPGAGATVSVSFANSAQDAAPQIPAAMG